METLLAGVLRVLALQVGMRCLTLVRFHPHALATAGGTLGFHPCDGLGPYGTRLQYAIRVAHGTWCREFTVRQIRLESTTSSRTRPYPAIQGLRGGLSGDSLIAGEGAERGT